jgi:hypothetical protein
MEWQDSEKIVDTESLLEEHTSDQTHALSLLQKLQSRLPALKWHKSWISSV